MKHYNAFCLQEIDSPVSAPYLWLATSADRRVSVWSADWTKDFCELVDWLTFPAPAFLPDGSVVSNKDKVKKNDKIDSTCDRIFKTCILCSNFASCRNLVRSCLHHWPNSQQKKMMYQCMLVMECRNVSSFTVCHKERYIVSGEVTYYSLNAILVHVC